MTTIPEALAARLTSTDDPEALTAWAFGPDGPLAAAGFVGRASQTSMALLVARAIGGGGWSAVEAPCGTGKSLAYLVPGLLWALRSELVRDNDPSIREDANGVRRYPDGRFAPSPGKPLPVLVSTANIALQGQLVGKDIPALAAAFGIPDLRVATLKGRNNYACPDKIADAKMLVGAPEIVDRIDALLQSGVWSGDREDLSWDPGAAWQHVSVDASSCIRKACRFYAGECPAERAKGELRAAHVVVTNHHYLALGAGLTPCLLAVDEAHELEDAVRGTRSIQIGRGSGAAAFARARADNVPGPVIDRAKRALDDIFDAVAAQRFANPEQSIAVARESWLDLRKLGDGTAADTVQPIADFAAAVKYGGPGCDPSEESIARRQVVAEALEKRVDGLRQFLDGRVDDDMYETFGECAVFAERERSRREGGEDRISARIVPAAVGPLILAIAHKYPAAVLTSATLGDLDNFALSVGFGGPDVTFNESVRLESPFDLPRQGLLVVPNGPGPKDPEWQNHAIDTVIAAVLGARGRTLVLCSTLRAVREYTAALRSHTPYEIKAQNEAGRATLREWFRDNTDGVLVGSRSFFQGLDVSGESCSCVVIDRVPFAPPGDPVEDAVGAHLAALAGGDANPFRVRSLPRAKLAIAQGAGRLIRTASDRGVVVMIDTRVATGTMARDLRAALPPFPMSGDIDDVARFFAGQPLEGVPKAPGGSVARRPRAGARAGT